LWTACSVLPKSMTMSDAWMCLQGYYQEAGRAGRDGLPSDCILYYAARDIPRIHQMLRRGSKGRTKQARFQKGMELLDQVMQSIVVSCIGALQVTHSFALLTDKVREVVWSVSTAKCSCRTHVTPALYNSHLCLLLVSKSNASALFHTSITILAGQGVL